MSTQSNSQSATPSANLETATFAAGCFWSVELAYQRALGVVHTEVGYTGGSVDNPSYDAVCSGKTGHAEAVKLEFDPAVTTYDNLLDIFFHKHDPTTPNRQGNDRGTQYRSAIFYHNDQQKQQALQAIKTHQPRFQHTIVTEVSPAGKWFRAEEYHQRYLERGGQCSAKGDKTPIRCYG